MFIKIFLSSFIPTSDVCKTYWFGNCIVFNIFLFWPKMNIIQFVILPKCSGVIRYDDTVWIAGCWFSVNTWIIHTCWLHFLTTYGLNGR